MRVYSRLTQPAGVLDLQEQFFPGGRVEIHGFATFRGERVFISGVRSSGLVAIIGPMSLHGLPGFDTDYQTGGVYGDVPFDSLARFWLIHTTDQDGVDERTPLPGLSTVVDGTQPH